jgi:hypothetical protein
MKQTAVDFLISHLQKSKDFQRVLNEVSQMSTIQFDLVEQAKEMFEQQIINAYCKKLPIEDGVFTAVEKGIEYYKETFGK